MKTLKNSMLGIGAVLACSPATDEGPDFSTPGLRGAPGGASDAVGFVDESSGTDTTAVCSGQIFQSERLPLDIYFLVDSSGSMADDAAGGSSKWDLVTGALIEFLGAQSTAEIGAGLGFFPEEAATDDCTVNPANCLCIPFVDICIPLAGGSCDPPDYAQPAVPLALPSAPERLIADIRARTFGGGTPTRPALEGAYGYVELWAAQNPGRKVVLVLATDGDPQGCDANQVDDVANLAASALAGANGIQTFVIGVGEELSALNEIARAGGTTQAFLTDTSGDLGAEFLDALDSIRTTAGACTLEIPRRTESGLVSPDLVNVRYTPNGSTESTIIPMTPSGSAADCDSLGGWHYDNMSAPTRIQLCNSTCTATRDANVEVEFGCQTLVR